MRTRPWDENPNFVSGGTLSIIIARGNAKCEKNMFSLVFCATNDQKKSVISVGNALGGILSKP